jgi:exonuclease SbcC
MFREVNLKNFRQHRDLTVNLTEGVIAVRGANEAGKTTILEAIAYALFGATALRDPLSDTVTYGEKESTLKVRVDFELNGAAYRVTRSKSGAEIRGGEEYEKIEATGQAEVTKFVETLLGASKDVCRNLMLADQQALRGALAKGPSAAIELIEKLANFSLIDTILGLVQDRLPCGTTTTVEARIQTLEAQVAAPVQDDTAPLAAKVEELEVVENDALAVYHERKADYDAVQEPAREAERRIKALAEARTLLASAKTRHDAAKAAYERINPVPGPTEAEIATLRKAADDASNMVAARAARRELEALPEPDNEWEGDYASLVADRDAALTKRDKHRTLVSSMVAEIAGLRGMRITQTACGLCGKDLTDVPEVASKNAEIDRKIEAVTATKDAEATAAEEADEMFRALNGIVAASETRQRVYQRHAAYITLDHGYVPARWTWTGPDTDAAVDAVSAQTKLRDALAEVQRYQMAVGQQTQARATLDQAERDYEHAMDDEKAAAGAAEGQQAVLDDAATKTVHLNDAQLAVREAQEALKSARQALEAGLAVVAERQRARDALEAQLKAAKEELVEVQDNNALITAIRKARPEITDELWDIASASISKHFSDIRGTDSTVTRADNGFKVDDRPITGLSGSTLDALGLAIRVALTKVFLPNTSFMMLDEPAAAADDQRESNMLGLISTCGFEQVVLITHSDLADSFASQVVRI